MKNGYITNMVGIIADLQAKGKPGKYAQRIMVLQTQTAKRPNKAVFFCEKPINYHQGIVSILSSSAHVNSDNHHPNVTGESFQN